MYPDQTSLIPVTVAVTRFIENHGFGGIYPYWYLGVPVRFLLGPVVPTVLIFFKSILPALSFFDLSLMFIFLSFLVSTISWGVFVSMFGKNKRLGIVSSVIIMILPWRYFSALAMEETSFTVARNLLPLALLSCLVFLKKGGIKRGIAASLVVAVLLLTNSSVLPALTVGFFVLSVSAAYKRYKLVNTSKYIKRIIIILIISFLASTLWYTSEYWMTILFNPSIGGASAGSVILRVFDLLRGSLPLFLALFVVFVKKKVESRLAFFSLVWLSFFLFLTIFRFIGDPDFWQDWTSWIYELEIGIALLLATFIENLIGIFKDKTVLQRYSKIYIVTLIMSFSFPFILSYYIYGLLGRPILLSRELPGGIRSLEKLSEIIKSDGEEKYSRVFLSGSTVFWMNALYDIKQVRGGVDKVATHPYWDHASYQIREGEDPELALLWLKSLGISYVLIHKDNSLEYYQDFKNFYKWKEIGEKVWEENGDMIVKVNGNPGIAWEIDNSKFNRKPKNGEDREALKKYTLLFKKKLEFKGQEGEYLLKNDEKSQNILLLLTYSKYINIFDDKGREVLPKKDLFGNTLIENSSSKYFKISIY